MIIVQYLVMRRDIVEERGIGFASAQLCHASMAPISNRLRADFAQPISSALDNETIAWLAGTFIKYVMQVRDADELGELLIRLKADGIDVVPIVESSIGQMTCLGLKPYNKGRVAPYFKNLKRLGEAG